MSRPRASTADLGGTGNTLKALNWTLEQEASYEAGARAFVARHLGDTADDVLEMLGLKEYESGTPPKKIQIRHGRRSSYTFHECRCLRCTRANADYFARRKENPAA